MFRKISLEKIKGIFYAVSLHYVSREDSVLVKAK